MSFLLRFTSRFSGTQVGTDRFGNVYFEGKREQAIYGRKRRWVIFNGVAEPTKVPPEWHAWLHHVTAAPLDEKKQHPWQEEHRPNLTGTPQAWRPAGHDYAGGQRRVTGGDYQAWTPGQ